MEGFSSLVKRLRGFNRGVCYVLLLVGTFVRFCFLWKRLWEFAFGGKRLLEFAFGDDFGFSGSFFFL